MITQYYQHIWSSSKKSLIPQKWEEVLQAIGRQLELIKKIEASSDISMMNASVCSFSSTSTVGSLVTTQKEVLEASQIFFQLLPDNKRMEIKSLLTFLRSCVCAPGHLSMDHILNEYSDILFTSSTWQSQTYRIDQVGEINYAGQILKLWIENHENITEMPV